MFTAESKTNFTTLESYGRVPRPHHVYVQQTSFPFTAGKVTSNSENSITAVLQHRRVPVPFLWNLKLPPYVYKRVCSVPASFPSEHVDLEEYPAYCAALLTPSMGGKSQPKGSNHLKINVHLSLIGTHSRPVHCHLVWDCLEAPFLANMQTRVPVYTS